MTSARFLNWEVCINARELGGYSVANGFIRSRALVRSDSSALLTKAGQQSVIDYGIRTIIDLRYPYELSIDPSPFAKNDQENQTGPAADLRPDYINIPQDQDQDLLWPGPERPEQMMSSLYRRMLELNRKHVAGVFTAIAHARPGGVFFHCHAGKDRTGLIAALILGGLGAPRRTILQDYALTSAPMEQKRKELLSEPSLTPDHRAYLAVLTSSLPETMLLTLSYLDRTYGGVEQYLQTTPLNLADLAAVRDRLVETVPIENKKS